MTARRRAVSGAAIVWAVTVMGATAFARDLTFEERVAAQKAIEQVYWSHRLWPKENPQPKPPLSTVMGDSAVRAKVEDYLKESDALETWWHRPVTGEQLQAEMDRMATGSHDPDVLRELFAALANDPKLIAETLARQTLVDRLIRNWYSNDTRFHASARSAAEAAVNACPTVDCMKSMHGHYRETTLKLRADDADGERKDRHGSVLHLRAGEWKSELDRVAERFGTDSKSIPERRLTKLEETTESFAVSAVLSRRDDEISTAEVTWPKRPFDSWWIEHRPTLSSRVANVSDSVSLPAVTSTACTNDTWLSTFRVSKRSRPTSLWTGTEMIVWSADGGRYKPATDSWAGISMGANSPVPRGGYSIVWTGTEMIIWGGTASGPLNEGARYNPQTDTWDAVSTGASAPTGRYEHSAVWTGTQMIVWGGVRTALPQLSLTTGGRYDPSTNTWTATSTAGAVPSARRSQTAVWTGTEMIIWGGSSGVTNLNSGGRYNPTSNTWATTSTGAGVASPRQYHTAVWSGTEMIIWGGVGGGYLSTGSRYDPSTDSWKPTSTTGPAPGARENHTTVWTGTEMIVWGGDVYLSGPGTFFYFNTGGRYRPSADNWTATSIGASLPEARQFHSAVWTGTEMIIWGGTGTNSDLNTGGRYSPSTDSWTPTSATGGVPTASQYHTAVWTGTEMIVWGGLAHELTDVEVNTGGCYNPATDSWTVTSLGVNVPPPRSGHTAVWTGMEMIVWGGWDNLGGRYNPATNSWLPTSSAANVPAGRGEHSTVWTGREMIIWGGYGPGGYQGDGGRYDPSQDGWIAIPTSANAPAPRRAHTAVWTGSEMLVWGGLYVDDSGYLMLNSGGRYSPSANAWTVTSTGANVPAGRYGHSVVWTGTEMIAWGGLTASGRSNTGGRYLPATDSWAATSTGASAPAARDSHRSVWTGTEMIVWGGIIAESTNTGGRYNPITDAWVATSTAAAVPQARFDHTAVWTGTQMIVWGGSTPTVSPNASGTGGRYCACPGGGLVYLDSDGDGYGDPSVMSSSCDGSVPAGYAGNGFDCDDLDAAVHPTAPEINDGLDNQCPGERGFGSIDEISGVSGFATAGDKTRFSWEPQSGAGSYEVVRSTTPSFSAGCTLTSASQTVIVDVESPTVGSAFFYLVRSSAPFSGSWGQRSDGTSRDVLCLAENELALRP